MGAWASGGGRQEFDGRGVDARAWDGRQEQVLADHPTIGVDMGAALCPGIPSQVAEVEARAALFSFLRSVICLRPLWPKMVTCEEHQPCSYLRGKHIYGCLGVGSRCSGNIEACPICM